MKKFVKWATETKADLRAHPILNEQLRVLEQCITTEALATLWACTSTLQDSGVVQSYPSDAVRNGTTAANLRARCDFHLTWLTDIVAACAPNTSAHIIKEIERIKFGDGATGGPDHWTVLPRRRRDVLHGQTATASTRTRRTHAHRPHQQSEAQCRQTSPTNSWFEEPHGVDAATRNGASRRLMGASSSKARKGVEEV